MVVVVETKSKNNAQGQSRREGVINKTAPGRHSTVVMEELGTRVTVFDSIGGTMAWLLLCCVTCVVFKSLLRTGVGVRLTNSFAALQPDLAKDVRDLVESSVRDTEGAPVRASCAPHTRSWVLE